MTISEGERVDLRKLHEAATPGPWKQGTDLEGNGLTSVTTGDWVLDTSTVADAALIAALRNAAPFLLDVVEAARIVAITPPGRLPRFAISVEAMEDAIRALDAHLQGSEPTP